MNKDEIVSALKNECEIIDEGFDGELRRFMAMIPPFITDKIFELYGEEFCAWLPNLIEEAGITEKINALLPPNSKIDHSGSGDYDSFDPYPGYSFVSYAFSS